VVSASSSASSSSMIPVMLALLLSVPRMDNRRI
jgi:hypothetical protein